MTTTRVEQLLRQLALQLLGALTRWHGQFDACEDAVQEVLLAAGRDARDPSGRRHRRDPRLHRHGRIG